jgi:hypothetical protein
MAISALSAFLVGGFSLGHLLIKEPALAESERVIRAEKYLLVDEGRIRGSWTTDRKGSALLTMTSDTGDIVLKVGDQAKSLGINSPSGKVSMEMEGNKVSVLIIDSRSRKRAEIGLEGFSINAKLFGNAGQILWSAP